MSNWKLLIYIFGEEFETLLLQYFHFIFEKTNLYIHAMVL